MLALAGIAAFSADAEMDPAAANPAIPLLTLRWTLSRKESVCGFNLLRGAGRDASEGHLY